MCWSSSEFFSNRFSLFHSTFPSTAARLQARNPARCTPPFVRRGFLPNKAHLCKRLSYQIGPLYPFILFFLASYERLCKLDSRFRLGAPIFDRISPQPGIAKRETWPDFRQNRYSPLLGIGERLVKTALPPSSWEIARLAAESCCIEVFSYVRGGGFRSVRSAPST